MYPMETIAASLFCDFIASKLENFQNDFATQFNETKGQGFGFELIKLEMENVDIAPHLRVAWRASQQKIGSAIEMLILRFESACLQLPKSLTPKPAQVVDYIRAAGGINRLYMDYMILRCNEARFKRR